MRKPKINSFEKVIKAKSQSWRITPLLQKKKVLECIGEKPRRKL